MIRELHARLISFDVPSYGKVRVEIDINYTDGQPGQYHLAAYPIERLKIVQ